VRESATDAGLIFKTIEDATPPASQPAAEPFIEADDDRLDDYSKGIVKFVCIYTEEKLAQRDARITKLRRLREIGRARAAERDPNAALN
jgi:hypothetical protein